MITPPQAEVVPGETTCMACKKPFTITKVEADLANRRNDHESYKRFVTGPWEQVTGTLKNVQERRPTENET